MKIICKQVNCIPKLSTNIYSSYTCTDHNIIFCWSNYYKLFRVYISSSAQNDKSRDIIIETKASIHQAVTRLIKKQLAKSRSRGISFLELYDHSEVWPLPNIRLNFKAVLLSNVQSRGLYTSWEWTSYRIVNRALIQYKDVILPVKEIPLWR